MKVDVTGRSTLEVMDKTTWYNDWLLERFSSSLRGKILEIGAGIGTFSNKLLKYGTVTATDINPEYIKRLAKNTRIKSGFGDIEKNKFFFKQESFDSIVCLNVLEHIKDDKKAITNCFSLLNRGGQMILLVPAHMALYSRFDKELGHFRRYSKNDVKTLMENSGFEVKVNYVNWWAAIGWWVFLKLFHIKAMPEGKVGIFDKFGRMFLWPEQYIYPPFGLSVLAIGVKK